MIAHLLPSSVIPDAAQWGAIFLTAVGGFGILRRRGHVLDVLSMATFSAGALAVVGMVGVAMLSPAAPNYTLSLSLYNDMTSPVQVTACATKPDGSAATTPDRDHVLVVLIDGVQVATPSANTFSVPVDPGTHSLRVELLTRDHREFNPAVAADTSVTVTRTAPSVGWKACASR